MEYYHSEYEKLQEESNSLRFFNEMNFLGTRCLSERDVFPQCERGGIPGHAPSISNRALVTVVRVQNEHSLVM